jgi:hypothetical protein
MLYACAEMLVWKIAHHEVESRCPEGLRAAEFNLPS